MEERQGGGGGLKTCQNRRKTPRDPRSEPILWALNMVDPGIVP